MDNKYIPWTEKYRPTEFEDIVLSDINKNILTNIIKLKIFPNLLFYGPPGTGKTTTIINLIKKYQKEHNEEGKDFIIHLNASDERGIDIIRSQISQFVNSKTLFKTGLKFVILDEVDYMTKNAQKALCYLLQNYKTNVRFCLICNYISKIDSSLQNEFIHLRFNILEKKFVINYLKYICKNENIKITNQQIEQIYKTYIYDIRSMINFIQMNHNNSYKIFNTEIIQNVINHITTNSEKKNIVYLNNICIKYNIEKENLCKKIFSYMIETNISNLHQTKQLNNYIRDVEMILHSNNINSELYLTYTISLINNYFLE